MQCDVWLWLTGQQLHCSILLSYCRYCRIAALPIALHSSLVLQYCIVSILQYCCIIAGVACPLVLGSDSVLQVVAVCRQTVQVFQDSHGPSLVLV
jgi:hypothetical protein